MLVGVLLDPIPLLVCPAMTAVDAASPCPVVAPTPPGNPEGTEGAPVPPGRVTGATTTLDKKVVAPAGPVDVTVTTLAMLATSVITPLGPDSRTAGTIEGGEPGLDVAILVRLRAVLLKVAVGSPDMRVRLPATTAGGTVMGDEGAAKDGNVSPGAAAFVDPPVKDSSDAEAALPVLKGEIDELGGADITPLDSEVDDDKVRPVGVALDPATLEADETRLLLEDGLTDDCDVESTTLVVGGSDCCVVVSTVDVLIDVKTDEDACVSTLSAASVVEDVADVVASEFAVLEVVLVILELVEPIALVLGVRSDTKMGGVVGKDMAVMVALENIGASEGRILKVCGGSVGVSGGSGGSGGSGSSRTSVKACTMAEVKAIVVSCSTCGSSVAVTVVVTVVVTRDVFSPDTVITQ